MRNDKALARVKLHLLSEGIEDFLGAWEFLWEARESLALDDPAIARAKAMGLIKSYLDEGLIIPGTPIGSGPGFLPWKLPASQAMISIENAWNALDREPVAGDICWFITTEKGKKWVRRQREEYPDDLE